LCSNSHVNFVVNFMNKFFVFSGFKFFHCKFIMRSKYCAIWPYNYFIEVLFGMFLKLRFFKCSNLRIKRKKILYKPQISNALS
jgi:hypothetical protein